MNELSSIVGAANVALQNETAVVKPANTDEVSALMRYCSTHRLTVVAAGGRTKLDWGSNAAPPKVILDTLRITGVLEHSWGDLTATVAAGTRWNDMQQVLAKNNQQVALDPILPSRATVGGILATNDSGLLRLKYGSLRDLVLGVTIVLADGTIARSGGKVVKNVAGYDLPKLLTGSSGTLGIITEATFRLHPVPKDVATYTVRSSDIASLAHLMSEVLKASMSLERMQLRNEELEYAVDIQFASLPEVLAEHAERLRLLATGERQERASESVFEARSNFFHSDGPSTILKVTALPSKLAAIVAGFAALNATSGVTAKCVADPVGIVTVELGAPVDLLSTVIDDLRARLVGSGGSVVVLRRRSLPEGTDTWGPAPPAIEVMRAVKREFDSQNLLNPGKFVGGI